MNSSAIFLFFIVILIIYSVFKKIKLQKELPELMDKGGTIIDVRSPAEFSSGHFKGSKNIPLDQLQGAITSLNKEETYLVCCASGARSNMAKSVLQKSGFKNVHNIGSWRNLPKG